jgi:hypothetical protein
MSDRPILTVGIPTWNRCSLLKQAVASIVREAEALGLSRAIEIVISDNASTDGTAATIADLQSATPVQIRYHRNDENVGAVRNVLRTVSLARGQYYMFCGDDDVLVTGALAAILRSLQEAPGQSAFAFLDPATPHVPHTRTAYSAVETARHFFYPIGNAGCFVFETAPAQRELARLGEDGFPTPWPQTQLMFTVMASRGSPTPCMVVPVAVASSPNHQDNTIYTSWYMWETATDGLLRTAHILDESGQHLVGRAARRHLFSLQRFLPVAAALLLMAAFTDERETVDRTRAAVRSRCLDRLGAPRLPLYTLLALVSLPLPLLRGAYVLVSAVRSPRRVASRVRFWRHQRTAQLRKRRGAAAARDYAQTGF